MSTEPTRPTRPWKIALVAALVAGPLFGAAVGTAFAAQTFPDVPPDHTFFKEVEWGAKHNIINGFTDGTFRPGQPVTRGQAAAFLSHYNDAIHTVSVSTNPSSNHQFALTASCPVGERAIGGAGFQSASDLFITDLYMSGRNYTVRWETDDNVNIDPTSLTVIAVCAPASALAQATGDAPSLPNKTDR